MQRNDPASASSPDRATPLSDETYPLITPAECDAFERHAEEGALIDIAGEGVGYSPVQPYDLVRFCRTVRELRETVTALRADAELLARIAESAVKWDEGGVAIVMSPTLWQEIRLAAAPTPEDEPR